MFRRIQHLCLIVTLLFVFCFSAWAADPMDFWNQQRRGANGDFADADDDWFRAAKASGIEWVRLSPAGLKPSGRDILLGNADQYQGIPVADLRSVIEVLDRAERHGVKVVMTVFSLPGCRWKQQNEDQFDYRLWNDESFQKQAQTFWRDLAKAIVHHPSIVGLNPLNEPHPEREAGVEETGKKLTEWLQETEGTPADLNRFNRRMVKSIREVAPKVPIMLDGRFHGNASGLSTIEKLNDEGVLYAFHFYEPWSYTTFRANKGRYEYPNKMPKGWGGQTETWTKEDLVKRMVPAWDWAKKNQVPSKRIVVSEFGIDRRVTGAVDFLDDLVSNLDEREMHWAFYSFRSRSWDGMDYELGTKKLDWKYWQGIEAGKKHEDLVQRGKNPLWDVLLRSMKK